MVPTIVPGYAAALGLIYIVLALRVIRTRRTVRIAIGAGEDAALARAIRVHGNFAEYVPLALLLLAFLEMQGAARAWLHLLCASLIVGRLVHAYGVSQQKENFRFRVIGMVTTFFVLSAASLTLLGNSLRALG
jgi:uncharacterized protein